MIKSSPRPSNIRRGRCGRIRNVEQLTRLKLSECLLKASLNAFAHARLPHSRAFALRSRSTKRPDGSCYPPMAVCVAGLVLGLHFVRRPSDVISSGHCWFGFDFSCASGPNLTFRFAWAFSGGLACASLKNARANQHSIECRRPQRACDGGGQPQQPAKARLAGEDCASDGRWSWHCRHHARHRQGQDGDLALAGTVWPRRRNGALARQNSSRAHSATAPRGSRTRCGPDLGRTAADRQPLDRRGDGEGRWHQHQFGATDLACSWLAAASGPPVQAVPRSPICGQAQRDRRPLHQPAQPRHRSLGR